jgi:hypothetical protein
MPAVFFSTFELMLMSALNLSICFKKNVLTNKCLLGVKSDALPMYIDDIPLMIQTSCDEVIKVLLSKIAIQLYGKHLMWIKYRTYVVLSSKLIALASICIFSNE